MEKKARVLVITGFGLNCETETAAAFEICGAETVETHLNDVVENPGQLHEFHIIAFIGGFSFGDHLGAGTVFASRIKHYLLDELAAFIRAGKLIIGICNGFQTLARLGILPALGGRYLEVQAALAHNEQGVFRDDWITLKGNPSSPCVFTQGIDLLPVPVRHGEGRFVMLDDSSLEELESNQQVAVYYVDPATGEPSNRFPLNPNGSTNAIAGICDPTGRIFGLMPHPEAYLSPYNHPDWGRQKINGSLPREGLGKLIFQNAVDFVNAELLSPAD